VTDGQPTTGCEGQPGWMKSQARSIDDLETLGTVHPRRELREAGSADRPTETITTSKMPKNSTSSSWVRGPRSTLELRVMKLEEKVSGDFPLLAFLFYSPRFRKRNAA
jgi:hypothetical protein